MKFHSGLVAASAAIAGVANAQSDQTLVPHALAPLPLGSIKPLGWLKDQMNLMSSGLAGHEHDFYEYVKDSTWLGGSTEYSDLREGFGYWFNALVSLAYGLDDDTLKDQVRSAADYVIQNQAADGWIGPETGTDRNLWGRMPVILGMTQLADADPDYTDKVVDSLYKFSDLMNQMLNNDYQGYQYHNGDQIPEGDVIWGRVRYQDLILSLQWMTEKHRGTDDQDSKVWDNMKLLLSGGMDWADWFGPLFIKEDLNLLPTSETDPLFGYVHNVNNAQGMKATGVVYRFTKNDSLPDNSRSGVDLTFQYHTAPSGAILGDERLDGLGPYYGSELCGVVELMFSLTTLQQIYGDGSFADKAELIAYNALPAQNTPDWWSHQYVAQPNQPYSEHLVDPGTDNEDTPFWNVGAWGQTFGLEPQYPCCTVNHPQGFPKFLAATFTTVGNNGGIAHALLAPASASVRSGNSTVNIKCHTNYPFDNTLRYTINTPSQFTFSVRVPSWADTSSSTLKIEGGDSADINPDATTGLTSINIPAGKTRLTYTIAPASQIVTEQRANDTIAVHAGRLLYALDIASSNTSTTPKNYTGGELPPGYAPPESRDYQITNQTSWAIAIDPSSLKLVSGDTSSRLADPIFAPGAPPSHIEAQGCEIDWPLYHAVAGWPNTGDARKCTGDVKTVSLVPYGAAKIRMTELPTIDLSGSSSSSSSSNKKPGEKKHGNAGAI